MNDGARPSLTLAEAKDLVSHLPPILDARTAAEPTTLEPYAIRFARPKGAPRSGVVRPHPEYAPMAGVLFQYDRNGWPDIVRDMVAELTRPGYAAAGGKQ